MAEQLLGLVLQERRIGEHEWADWFAGVELGQAGDARVVAQWQVESGHLDVDAGMLFAAPEAERRHGRVHYRDLMAVFTADPEMTVFHGRTEIGSLDPMAFTRKVDGPRVVSLAGRACEVGYIDWQRRRAYVQPSDRPGSSKWMGMAQAQSFALADAVRRVLLGTEPEEVAWTTRRAQNAVRALREDMAGLVDADRTVVSADQARMRWWTWAGARAKAVLVAALDAVEPDLLGETITYDNWRIALRGDATPGWVSRALRTAREQFGDDLTGVLPHVDDRATQRLKFTEMLSQELARATLAARMSDHAGAASIAAHPVSQVTHGH